MTTHATFLFHGSLNDFLPEREKNEWNSYPFPLSSSLKDTIEAIGIPHVEVMKAIVNGKIENFSYQLQPNDSVEIFPFENQFPENVPKSFVLDVHLGKLARLLRMLGVDTIYRNGYDDKEIAGIAVQENRSVLTRDIGLLKHKVLQYGYWLRSQHPEEQMMEVMKWFSLCPVLRPFSRCIACNGLLSGVAKKEIIQLLPPQTITCFEEFYQCSDCRKVYWKGSHFENMERLIERVKSIAC